MSEPRAPILIGLRLVWIVWVLIDLVSIEGLMLGEKHRRRAEGYQEQHERDNIMFDDFITEFKDVDKKDAELLENAVQEKEVATASSSNEVQPPPGSTSLPRPQRKGADWLGRPSSEPIAHDTDSRPARAGCRPNPRSESDSWCPTIDIL